MRFGILLALVLFLTACESVPPVSRPLLFCRTATISGVISCDQACQSLGAVCASLVANHQTTLKSTGVPPASCDVEAGKTSLSCRCCKVD